MGDRIAITGLGAVTSVGIGVAAFVEALRTGASRVERITAFDTAGFEHCNGCEVHDFAPGQWTRQLDPARLGRATLFSIAAARMAMEDAGLTPASLGARRCGVSIGTTEGECQSVERLTRIALDKGMEALDADLIRQVPANTLSVSVARELDLHGDAITLGNACAAGNYAIGYAYDLIALGEADAMVCGGADAMSRKTFAGFYRLGTIAPQVCQPFDKQRKGILTGEGAGIFVLESLASARARGARIYAEILGYGMNEDAYHPVAPDRESIARCMRLAHCHAGIQQKDVDYISAHGTGTIANDATEAAAIRDVFGTSPPPVSALKSMIGHSMGAASALAGVASVLAMHHGFIPPTINCHDPDVDLGIDCVPNQARPAALEIIQNNGFAFGGNNAIMIIRKFHD
jgi:3-oxoacyl-[acyl-carrier-protein] synthase II